jgi:hypothetical protein
MLCNLLKVKWCFRQICRLHHQGQRISQARDHHKVGIIATSLPTTSNATYFMLVACLAYSLTLQMEVLPCSSKTLVDSELTTQYHISEDRGIHTHCCENLKSYK